MSFPERGVRVSWSFWLLVVFAAVASPTVIVLSVFLAAALHECGHLLMLRIFRVNVEGLRLSALGAVLYARGTQRLSYGRELAVTLAGPAVNLLFGFLTALCSLRLGWVDGFVFAGAHLLLAAFNLLPVPPLDGSRALYLAVSFFFGPMAGDTVTAVTGTLFSLALSGAALWLHLETGAGLFFLLAALALLFGALEQLRLAKRTAKV